jgi:(4S)-4-hydroxy-5-phosphonooxypentane-2,3-dione isomerase
MADTEQPDGSSTWVVTVEFTIRHGFASPFRSRVDAQAAESLLETGCFQFDVCVDPLDEHRVFLYEVYSSREAFATHLASAHFKDFDGATRPWVSSKTVAQWRLAGKRLPDTAVPGPIDG